MAKVEFEENGTYADAKGEKWPAQITGYNLEGRLPPEYLGEKTTAPAGIFCMGVGYDAGELKQKRVEIKEIKAVPYGRFKPTTEKDKDGKIISKQDCRPVWDILANVGRSKQGQILRFIGSICEAKYLFSGVDSGSKHSFTPKIEEAPKAAAPKAEKK